MFLRKLQNEAVAEDGVPTVKRFNATGGCNPVEHYMVDISAKVRAIKQLVDDGYYLCVNRARQYGKTTTLTALADYLKYDYVVVSLDFQDIGSAVFESEGAFTQGLARLLVYARELLNVPIPHKYAEELNHMVSRRPDELKMDELFFLFRRWCRESERGIVLIIDEVDTASSNQVFLDFLAQLRSGYLRRRAVPSFQSVILAGVTDVRHLKARIRTEDAHGENSPWNIAADFNIDMSLSESGIKGMLDEYEEDHHTHMDTAQMARSLRKYTSGYPYLVSRLCLLMDGVVAKGAGLHAAWTEQGLDEAIKVLLADGDDTLFSSLMGKLENMPRLKDQLRDILMRGDVISWRPDDKEQALLRMYGFIVNNHNCVQVANRIFEMRLYQYFLGESQNHRNDAYRSDALLHKSIFVNDDQSLNMPLILEHFVEAQRRIHGDAEDAFLEEEGRERFLTYLAPIINGTGTYSIEEQTRNKLRMDVVVHYLGRKYVVELKVWRGARYNEAGERQIAEYLDYFGLSTGYMVSFCFNKSKVPGVKRVAVGDKVVFEAIV